MAQSCCAGWSHATLRQRSSCKSKSRSTAARFWRASKARRCLCRWRCPASRRACELLRTSAATRPPKPRRLLPAAPERVAPACPHFGACGGCQYQHADYAAQLAFKQAILRETLERGGVRAPAEIAVLAAEPWAYRNRIRLAFDAEGNVGYRGRRSHAVIPIAECPIAAPVLLQGSACCSGILPEVWPHQAAPWRSRSSRMLKRILFWPAFSPRARRRSRLRIISTHFFRKSRW